LDNAHEYAEEVAKLAERFEGAIGEGADVGGETNTQNIEGEDFSCGMGEADQVDGTGAICKKSFERSFGAFVGEITQEGIAGAEGKKSERDALRCWIPRENAIENFVGRTVAADGEKFSVALRVGLAGKLHGMAWAGGRYHVNMQAFFAQTSEGRAGEFGGFAATGGGIHDSEEAVFSRGHGH
jgi:hypothetical protein